MRPLLLAAAALAVACAPVSRFTRADELDAMAREPLPESPRGAPLREVDAWALEGELPTTVSHLRLTQAEGPLAPLLAKAATNGAVPSADLMCIARQTARLSSR